MSANRSHLVVDTIRTAPGLSFDTVQRIRMRQNPHLPRPFGRPGQYRLLLVYRRFFKGTIRFVGEFAVAQNHPALRDGISSDFHTLFAGSLYERISIRS